MQCRFWFSRMGASEWAEEEGWWVVAWLQNSSTTRLDTKKSRETRDRPVIWGSDDHRRALHPHPPQPLRTDPWPHLV